MPVLWPPRDGRENLGGVVLQHLLKRTRNEQSAAGSDSFRLISDVPADFVQQGDDHLKFLPFADALAFLIDQKVDHPTPLIVAISAPWGAGKTTLAALTARQLRKRAAWDQLHIICQFNAWQHDDAPHLGAAFAADIAQHVNGYRRWWRRIIQPLPSPMLTPELRWRRKCIVILISLVIAIGLVLESKSRSLLLAAMQPTDARWKAAEHDVHGIGLSALILVSALAFIYPKIFSGTKAVARFIDDPQAEAARGSMASVRKQLGELVHSATRGDRRLIIFVDDLERCRPPRAVEVCEVAAQLLNHRDIVTVLVADMHVIAMSAAIKYRGLELPAIDQSDSARAAYEQYGREYLQKLVHVQFDLPPAGPAQLKKLLGTEQLDVKKQRRSFWLLIRTSLDSTAAAAIAGIGAAAAVLLPEDIVVVAPLVGVGIATLLGARLLEAYEKARAKRARSSVDESIRQTLEQGATFEQTVKKVTADKQGRDEGSVRKRTIHALLEELARDKVMQGSDELVYQYIPDRPRAAKRLLNQVRLTIIIALHRELIDDRNLDQKKDNAKRVAKWVILQERWPEVALAGSSDMEVVAQLESWARDGSVGDLRIGLKGCGVGDIENLEDLRKLLSCPPAFGDMRQLITLGGSTAQ